MDVLGRHVIVEMWGCCKDTINNSNGIKDILAKSVAATEATLVDVVCHHFSPYGVTGVAILAESHVSVHTWPEYEYAAVDIFICNNNVNPIDMAYYIRDAFYAKETSLLELKRGNISTKKIHRVGNVAKKTKLIKK